jgi:hypothetical protein
VNLYPILDRLKIQDRETGLICPWDINWAQREYIDEFQRQWNTGKPVRIIVLKARQLGISTATQGMGFGLCFVMPDTQELTVGHGRNCVTKRARPIITVATKEPEHLDSKRKV